MTNQERSDFYDQELAPLLDILKQKCKQCGFRFLARVEWDQDLSEKPIEGCVASKVSVLWVVGSGLKLALAIIEKIYNDAVVAKHES